ncbi:hypothetical protein GGI07_004805 [Coemansia sp. Benny D115]|nr:hypothetical protein GGI07_004805 [Coemansia sp. Benny D115]
MVGLTTRRSSMRASQDSTANSRRQNHRQITITRIDKAPTLNVSIPALETLFEQYNSRDFSTNTENTTSKAREALAVSLPSLIDTGTDLDSSKETIRRRSIDCVKESPEEYPPPSPTSTTSTELGSNSSRTSEDTANESDAKDTLDMDTPTECVNKLLDSLFLRPEPHTRPYHTYFIVATIDGKPAIPEQYTCPTSMCTATFTTFEALTIHWSEHPWNRRSILLPVAAGGIRRLGFWQHKARFIKSLINGPHVAEIPGSYSSRPSTGYRRNMWTSICQKGGGVFVTGSQSLSNIAKTSDYGDIQLFGPQSYFVSPRVLPLEQVRAWEATRNMQSTIPNHFK